MSEIEKEVGRRKTFAIISHPDAGKTTLTEKLLLYGGAIATAGEVKARGDRRRAKSDWLKVERERGISVTSSVMTFDFGPCRFNLLDTPGHEDFSEDTYRTLTAVDSAIMVLDVAKGIERQTKKLFEVCRLRDMPIVTFINKLDREGKDPFELLDEVEETLALDVVPASWPIGMGNRFRGVYDLFENQLILMNRKEKNVVTEGIPCSGLDDPKLNEHLDDRELTTLRDEVEMVRGLCKPFDVNAYLEGTQTPVYFGSALSSFGVRELMGGLVKIAPTPKSQKAKEREVLPTEEKVSGFVFKIQANMDPKHRDRIAFVRLCAGHFERGMKLKNIRTGKTMSVHNAMMFQAQDRELTEDAYAGDIVGIPNHGALRIGDTLAEKGPLHYIGIPSFAPEILQKVRAIDPMKGKHLGKALIQLAEEGAAQVFKTHLGSEWIVGVVGSLQFDVLADRIRTEYDLEVKFEATSYQKARWLEAEHDREIKAITEKNRGSLAEDHSGTPVFLARNDWQLSKAQEDWPQISFISTKEQTQ